MQASKMHMQNCADMLEVLPASQSMQDIDPCALEYLPAAQSEHASGPVFGLFLPGTHASHRQFLSVEPGLHEHLEILIIVAKEPEFVGHKLHLDFSSVGYEPWSHTLHVCDEMLDIFPVAHSVHAPDPEICLYFPGTHPTQFPFVPVHPALQEQAVTALLMASENEFSGHRLQRRSSSVEKEPAAQ